MTSLYSTLNISKTASQEEIKAAYRKLAKQYHPDFHRGDAENEKRFKAISQAYEILGDAKKRGQYDRGEIDEQGNEKNFFHQRRKSDPGHDPFQQFHQKQNFGQGWENSDLFTNVFGDMFSQKKKAKPEMRLPAQEMTLSLTFEEAALGTTKKIKCPSGKTVELTIQRSSLSEQRLKVSGQGAPDPTGRIRDLIVILDVKDDGYFRRDKDDVHSDLLISLEQAILGDKVKVKTIDGTVSLTIKPHSNTDQVMRLKDKGIPNAISAKRGHHYVHLKIKLDDPSDSKLEKFIKKHYSDKLNKK